MTRSRSEQIFDHALKFATPFATPLGHPWAIIPDGGSRYLGWPVASRRFREWLAYAFHHEHGLFPGTHALDTAIRLFAAHAHHSEFPTSEIFARLGFRGSRLNPQSVLLHLANAENELVEITPRGHEILSGKSWRFLAAPSTLALPRPIESGGTLADQLSALLGIRGPELHRATAWLFAAMRPAGPYPILLIAGPPASGKSTLARILRSLIDPSHTPLFVPPAKDRDLFTIALHNRVLAFDDIHAVSPRTALSLARIASGAGLAISGANIFDDPLPFTIERPIIVTTSVRHPRCFAANAIHIRLANRGDGDLRTLAALERDLEAAAPSILGALCQAVSAALSNISSVRTDTVSRFPDVHQWTTAAAPQLGLSTEQINGALAASPLIDDIHCLLEADGEWTGTAAALAKILHFTSSPNHLSQQLASLPLALFGISFEAAMGHRDRHIRLAISPPAIVSRGAA